MSTTDSMAIQYETTNPSHAFEFLRAEDEGEWLHHVFVAPDGFQELLRPRSTLILGASGSGKSALRHALLRQVAAQERAPLVLDWSAPLPQITGPASSATYQKIARRLLEAASIALLRGVAAEPRRFQQADRWVTDTAADLVATFVPNRARLLQRLERTSTPEGAMVLRTLLQRDAHTSDDEDPLFWMAELSEVVAELGWHGVWILMDGFDVWEVAEQDHLTSTLQALLNSLGQFEIRWLSLKIFAPEEYEDILIRSSALVRRRADVYRIRWRAEQLRALVEKRLALVLGDTGDLASLCAQPDWIGWLEKHIDLTPRDWLVIVRAMLDEYRRQGAERPLSPENWERIRVSFLPLLRVNLEHEQVYQGRKLVATLTPVGYKLLRYLYTHPQRLCSRKELYYRGYLGLESIPARGEENWYPEWRGWIDTNIGRLRETIEPDPSNPIYIVTERGKGIALRHTEG